MINMNGAQFFMSTLASNGVSVCFANPGTSELHLVEAIDSTDGMRGVLTLFEGVATGAADGYGRMTDRPAAVLLHLGPGLANGLANLHNARRAGSPVICIVGEQALYHRKYDPPLNVLSGIDSLASSVSAVVLMPVSASERGLEGVATKAIASIVAGASGDMGGEGGLYTGFYTDVTGSSGSGYEVSDSRDRATRRAGRVATILMPADISWTDVSSVDDLSAKVQNASIQGVAAQASGAQVADMEDKGTKGASAQATGIPATSVSTAITQETDNGTVEKVAGLLDAGGKTCFLLGGRALRERPIRIVADIASLTGARVFAEALPARIQRGGSIPVVDRLGYLPEIAIDQLSGIDNLILVDSPAPVSFFAYKGVPSLLAPSSCQVIDLASGFDDIEGTLGHLGEAVSKLYGDTRTSGLASAAGGSEVGESSDGSDKSAAGVAEGISDDSPLPSGKLDGDSLGKIFAALLPENSIVVDEGVSEGLWAYIHSIDSPVHDWLCLSGGAIGQGMPLSIGAATACPDRKVINLEADGSAMYTIQSLWTQARESLDIVTIILANRSYRLLQIEMDRLNIDRSGPSSNGLTGIASPEIDYASIARSMGVSAVRVDDADAFASAFSDALSAHGPHLIEAVLS